MDAIRATTAAHFAVLAALTVGALACGDIKSAGPPGPGGEDGGPDTGPSGPGAPDASPDAAPFDPARNGPGPHGSLPSGYCCTDDKECRYRRCVDPGGGAGKMCLDECSQQIFCTRPDITFTCVATDAGRSLCRPPAGFACIPSAKFTRGTDPVGACCNASDPGSSDGTAGSNCEGNQCVSAGTAPLVCTHRCAFAQDCPGGFECGMFGTSKACLPTTANYTCQ
jgi:hypothetical protein